MHSWHDDGPGRHWRKWISAGGHSLGSPDHCRLTSHRFGRSRQAPRLFGQTGSGSSQPHPRRGSFGSGQCPALGLPPQSPTIDLVFVCRPTTPVPGRPHRFRPPRPRRPGDHAPASPCAPQLVQPSPGGLITAQAKNALQAERTDPVLLVGHVPHRLEPKAQWLSSALEDRPRRHRCLTLTPVASQLTPRRRPGVGSAARRASKTFRPTNTPKKLRTRRLRHEPRVEFSQGARVVDPAFGMGCRVRHPNILTSRERSGYPISGFVRSTVRRVLSSATVELKSSGRRPLISRCNAERKRVSW